MNFTDHQPDNTLTNGQSQARPFSLFMLITDLFEGLEKFDQILLSNAYPCIDNPERDGNLLFRKGATSTIKATEP